MDVLVLIDKLDDTVHNAKQVPLTDTVRVDKEEIYDILDQMRATIPEEIKQARWIVKERQGMLAQAKPGGQRLIGGGRGAARARGGADVWLGRHGERAGRGPSRREFARMAERQAQDIVDDARRQARETR